jgi:hypothetical protein
VNKSAGRTGFWARPVVSSTVGMTQIDNLASDILYDGMTREQIREKLISEKWAEYVQKLESGELYNGNCPLDPFEKVMCTSCQ